MIRLYNKIEKNESLTSIGVIIESLFQYVKQ